ncbi:MAG: methylenetetrahydrofolate reductase [Candidatus Helarchaeota archaeon]|nr:methylenetetrahydrofolate reductase [Candidatus Helarchaeota archaeon]
MIIKNKIEHYFFFSQKSGQINLTPDFNGKEIHDPPKFHVGIAGNPNCVPLEAEILKLGRKIESGAEFVQTQVIYDVELTKTFLKEMERYKFPILIGIFPIESYGVAA